jgi:opacity protein-like surface antigen
MYNVKANFRPAAPVEVSGWTVRAGLAISMTEHVAVFGEWRLSQDPWHYGTRSFSARATRSSSI